MYDVLPCLLPIPHHPILDLSTFSCSSSISCISSWNLCGCTLLPQCSPTLHYPDAPLTLHLLNRLLPKSMLHFSFPLPFYIFQQAASHHQAALRAVLAGPLPRSHGVARPFLTSPLHLICLLNSLIETFQSAQQHSAGMGRETS